LAEALSAFDSLGMPSYAQLAKRSLSV
jgi:hypothetical protein